MQQFELFCPDEINGPQGQAELDRIQSDYQGCVRCGLHERRKNIVFGKGNPDTPSYAFVGEAPGQVEDETGEPFVGRSGKLLDKMITAMGLAREHVFVVNVCACRPPENRSPKKEEVLACSGLLHRQLQAVSPRILVALGTSAAQALLQSKRNLSFLRGKWHVWNNTPLRVTYHPAALLRNPEWKTQAWNDLQEVMKKGRELHL